MRVEAVGEMPRKAGASGSVAEEPGAALAIKSFLAALESDDSLFCVAQPLTGPSRDESAGGGIYSGDVVIEFREHEHARNRRFHFLLIERLIELLKEAGSQQTLEATLCLTQRPAANTGSGGRNQTNQQGLVLWMRLAAKGDTAEQAVLRWGLGLAHLQQALLFVSRYLRMHLTQKAPDSKEEIEN